MRGYGKAVSLTDGGGEREEQKMTTEDTGVPQVTRGRLRTQGNHENTRKTEVASSISSV